MKKIYLLLAILLPLTSQARLIDKCGIYNAEGFYTQIESVLHTNQKKSVILLDRGSRSEIKFYISNDDIQKLIPNTHLGVNFKLKLSFESSCYYACEGKIIEVLEPLDPFENPKSFLNPRPSPIAGTEFKCKHNSFEDERQPSSAKK